MSQIVSLVRTAPVLYTVSEKCATFDWSLLQEWGGATKVERRTLLLVDAVRVGRVRAARE